MVTINILTLAGNLTRDPEHKIIGQTSHAQMGLALNERWKDATGETAERTTFVEVECWGKTADLVHQYLRKGHACLVEGRIQQSQWETAEGQKRSRLFVRADRVQFLTPKPTA